MGHITHLRKRIKSINTIFTIHNYLPLEKGVALLLNKFKSSSPTKFVEIGPDVLEKKIFKSMLFCNYLPFEKSKAGYLNKLEFHPRMLCAKFGWNRSNGSGEEDENVKSLQQQKQQQPWTMAKFWSEKLTWAIRWAKKFQTDRHVCLVIFLHKHVTFGIFYSRGLWHNIAYLFKQLTQIMEKIWFTK